MIETLIYNRTQADVDYVTTLKNKFRDGTISAAEKAEYNAGLKGCYNASDMNRVGRAINEIVQNVATIEANIQASLTSYGLQDNAHYHLSVSSSPIVAKTNWAAGEVITVSDANDYINNIASIRNMIDDSTIPQAPTTLNNLTYQIANDIEKILYDVDAKLTLAGNAKLALIESTANGRQSLPFEINTNLLGNKEEE